jgi:hypothetical protein
MTLDRAASAKTPIEKLTISAAFVILWASGFIGAKLGLPYAEPLTFLFLRMFGAVLLLGGIALYGRPKWPDRTGLLDSCAIGVFMHALYLGGVYVSIANGLPAALSALIVGLQPLLTSTVANRLLGEQVVARQWAGLLLGIAGIYLVVQDRASTSGVTPLAWIASLVALLSITFGTIYQKRFGSGIDWRVGNAPSIRRSRSSFCPRCSGVRNADRTLDAPISVRALLAHPRALNRRHLPAVFSYKPVGGYEGSEPVLSYPAGNGHDCMGTFQ